MRTTRRRRATATVAASVAAGVALALASVPATAEPQAPREGAVQDAGAGEAPARADSTPNTELVVNGGSESGTQSWAGQGGATLSLGYSTRRSGATSLKVNGRDAHTDGAVQPLTGMVAGSTYTVAAWIHYRDLGDPTTTFAVVLTDGAGVRQVMAQAVVPKGSADATLVFQPVTGTFTAPATGFDVKTAKVSIETLGGAVVPDIFFVDDVSVVGDREVPPPPPDQLERNDNTEPGSFGAFAKFPGTEGVAQRGNPLVTQNFGADPWAMEVDGRVYVYTTNDTQEWANHLATGASNSYGRINQINVWSSADMMNWTNHGPINAAGAEGITRNATGRPGNSWAPAAASKDVDGDGDEEFFLYFANSAGGIWVLQGESPTGPFTSPRSNALVGFDTPGVRNNSDPDATDTVWLFDPAVLVDDDGEAYLYFGGGVPTTGGGANDPDTARVAKLGPDMTSLADSNADGTPDEAKLINAPAIFEDSGIHKVGDTYYYTYCTNFSFDTAGKSYNRGDIVVMESQDPMGPWSEPRLVFPNQQRFFGQGTGGNNHHAFFSFQDEWYLTYHAPTLDAAIQGPANAAGFRNAHIEPVTLDADGSVQEVVGTYEGPGQLATLDPYAGPISAETIAWQAGTRQGFEGPSTFEGQTPVPTLTSVDARDWTSLSGVDFGLGATSVTARVLPRDGGTISVRSSADQGSDDNVLATMTVPAGDGTAWTTMTADLPAGALAGVADVFFTYDGPVGAAGQLFDVQAWTFAGSPTPPVDPPVETPAAVVSTAVPTIAGTPAAGQTLTATSGSWSVPNVSLAYQWLRNGTPVAGATAATYAVGAADVGSTLQVRVTATAPGRGAGTATSVATAPVTTATTTAKVKVKGKAVAGKRTKVTVKVGAAGIDTVRGTLKVRWDGKVLTGGYKVKANGKVVLTLPAKARGKHALVVTYRPAGSSAGVLEKVKIRKVIRIS